MTTESKITGESFSEFSFPGKSIARHWQMVTVKWVKGITINKSTKERKTDNIRPEKGTEERGKCTNGRERKLLFKKYFPFGTSRRSKNVFLPATVSLIWPMLRSGKITFPAITWWWVRIIFIGTTPGVVIAHWIRPRQPSCGPGFESSAQHFFSLYSQSLKNICYWFEKRTKIIEERSGKTHVKNST